MCVCACVRHVITIRLSVSDKPQLEEKRARKYPDNTCSDLDLIADHAADCEVFGAVSRKKIHKKTY